MQERAFSFHGNVHKLMAKVSEYICGAFHDRLNIIVIMILSLHFMQTFQKFSRRVMELEAAMDLVCTSCWYI